MSRQDDLNAPMIALVGFLGAVMVFVIVVFLVVVYRQVATQRQYANDVSQPYGEITDLVTRQRDALASYGWVDQEKGIVSLPVDRAVDLVVAEIRATGRAVVTQADEAAGDTAGPADESGDADKEAGDAQPEQ